MYEERRDNNKFLFRDIILQFIFIILFIFILVWLFPSKTDINELSGKFDVLTNRIFNENIQTMKEAAIGYYTTPRLPQKVGDKVKMTLQQMEDKYLVIPFTDANGNECDKEKSYVEMIKYEDEYQMKVNLKCTDNDAYIMVYLGCYDYCDSDVCERESSKPVNNTGFQAPVSSKPEEKPAPVPTPNPEPKPSVTYSYEYIKVINGSYTDWSSWSNWSTDCSKTSNDLTEVREKTEKTTVTEKTLIGYKNTTYVDYDQPIYEEKQVQTGTEEVQSCVAYGTKEVKTGEVKYKWVSAGTDTYYTKPQGSSTVKYEYKGLGTEYCGDCAYGYYEIYEKFVLEAYDVVETQKVCTKYETKTQPIYVTVKDIVGYKTWTEKEPVYKDIEKTKETKYCSFRTRTLNEGKTLIKWSYYNDTTLLNQGYNYTGNFIAK